MSKRVQISIIEYKYFMCSFSRKYCLTIQFLQTYNEIYVKILKIIQGITVKFSTRPGSLSKDIVFLHLARYC